MRMRKKTTAFMALAVGSLLGWLTASGPLNRGVHADETQRPAHAAATSSVLPIPSEPFKGTINLRAKDSKSDFPQPVQAPKGAPNVLLVLLDDVGFGASSTFGGPCNTPTLEKLAASGLRYNQFHTTALCSPTRAALITGRNHHTVAHRRHHGGGDGVPGI